MINLFKNLSNSIKINVLKILRKADRASQSCTSNTSGKRSRLAQSIPGCLDNKKTMSPEGPGGQMSRKDSGSAGPFMGSSRWQRTLLETTSTSWTKEIRYTAARYLGMRALPYSSIFRPVPIPLSNRGNLRREPVPPRSYCERCNSPAIDYADDCLRRQFERRAGRWRSLPRRSISPGKTRNHKDVKITLKCHYYIIFFIATLILL